MASLLCTPASEPCLGSPKLLPSTQGHSAGAKALCWALEHTGLGAPALPALTGDGEQHPACCTALLHAGAHTLLHACCLPSSLLTKEQ